MRLLLRLPKDSGFMFNFQWGKTLRGGADHLMTVPYNEKHFATCPGRAGEQFIEVGKPVGWDMTSGHLFLRLNRPPRKGENLSEARAPSQRRRCPRTSSNTPQRQRDIPIFDAFTPVGGRGVSRALAGDTLSPTMQKQVWKNPGTLWRYMKLMDLVSPGADGNSMVVRSTEDQYKENTNPR